MNQHPSFLSIAAYCVVLFAALFGCRSETPAPSVDGMSWEEVVKAARGSTVRMAMWDGDPMINAYMRDFVAPRLKKEYGVELKLIGGQGNSLVNKLMVDKETQRTTGDIDVMWINGETFYQLRQLRALYGPFTERLPNNQYIDWSNPFIALDFQQPVNGYECPWGNVQLAIIYHPERVSSPPRTKEELAEWVKKHPGRFTFDNSFTGMTFLKGLLYEFAGGPDSLHGPFDEAKYLKAAEKLWEYLEEIKPHLWRNGETYPESVAQLHQLFMNGEVDFTMSNNDGEVDNKAIQGVIPKESKGYIFDFGTIRNTHYLGVPFNSPNKAGALVLANFMISPEAQLEKPKPAVWGDGAVLDLNRLPAEWKAKFENIPGRERIAPREELEKNALMEPASEIMVRLHDGFRKRIIEAQP